MRRMISVAGLVVLSLAMCGCPRTAHYSSRPAPTPRTSIPAPRIQARAHPAFRLVIPPRPIHAPTRLVVVFVHIENIDDVSLLIRPDLIRLELPDGSTRFALDKPRAVEILKRSLLARFEPARPHDSGRSGSGLTKADQRRWERRFREELLSNTRLGPGEAVEGFVIVDTTRTFVTLDDTVVQAIAEPVGATEDTLERYPVRVMLGAPIEIAP